VADASALIKAKRFLEAEAAARARLQVSPGDLQALRWLGRALEGQGRRRDAISTFMLLVDANPADTDALHRLAMVYAKAGVHREAMGWFARLTDVAPDRLDAWVNRATAAKSARAWAEAKTAYEGAIRLSPGSADLLDHRGLIDLENGAANAAVGFFRRAVVADPNHVEARVHLGRALRRMERVDEAEASFRFALHLRPGHADATARLARILQQRERFDEAAALIERARVEHATDPILVRLQGITYGKLGRALDAAAMFRLGTELSPEDGAAWANLCSALWNAGQPHAAVEAGRRAVELAPTVAIAHHALGLALDALKDSSALQHLRRALSLAPSDDAIRCDIAQLLRRDSKLDEAMSEYRAILARRPDYTEALSGAGGTAKDAGRAAEALVHLRRAVALRPDDQALWDGQLLTMQYDPGVSPADLRLAHDTWGARAVAARPRAVVGPRRPGPLRIGYVSGDFGHHPVGSFLIGVLPCHDRREVQVHCYSSRHVADDYTDRFKAAADRWRDVAGMSEIALTEAILADDIDILVDLAGHTKGHRLGAFARKPARVQATWAGYVGTVGLPTIDWLIADKVHMPPGSEAEAIERIWRMPHGYVSYTPSTSAPDVLPPPSRRRGYVTFGCFNNVAKLSPAAVALWCRVLEASPKSRLKLLSHSFADAGVQARYRALFGPVADRVELHGRVGHRALLKAYAEEIDIALDPLPYSGGATTLEALWMGVPVITLGGGDRFCSRHSSGHTTHIGEPWMVAPSPDAYVALAARLAADDVELAAVRARLRPKMAASPVCDGVRFARDLEVAFRAMFEARQA
jgi:protein O-GlcNAc transferase